MSDGKIKGILKSANRFLVVFLLVAFIITCCMTLFLTILSKTLGIDLNGDNLDKAAKYTMGNVVFLSLLLSVIDGIRRKLTVDIPAKRITDAAERITKGDFSVRIRKSNNLNSEDRFNEIADCFNTMAKELESTETLRTDFIANVSHELKTPLAVMQNYGKLLQSPGLTESERLEYAKAVTDACDRLAKLIANILKLNKLENQQITPLFESYNLTEQICQCLIGFENTWEKKEINIETDIEDEVFVKSDAEMMSIVWNNLFSNAFKFTEKGGTVFVTLKKEGDGAVVKVKDTGCGISKQVGEHIFDKFYQGDTSHSAEGNGLGLALVKRVVDMAGGEISVESEINVGSTFTIKI